MFATVEDAVDRVSARRLARRCELRSLCVEQARIAGRITQLVRDADDERDWEAAGCASSAEWLARLVGERASDGAAGHAHRGARCGCCRRSTRRSPRVRCRSIRSRPRRSSRRRRRMRSSRACGRAAAEPDRRCRAQAGAARRRGRRRAVRAPRAADDVDAGAARARRAAAGCRSSWVSCSSRRSGTSRRPSARPTSATASCSTGSSRPRTRSSPRHPSRRGRGAAQRDDGDRAPRRRRAAVPRRRRADQRGDRGAARL